MNISFRTIQRSLNEKGYEYVGWKIKSKDDLHDQKIRFNWYNRLINDNWYNIFSQTKLQFSKQSEKF